jgi:hypothetical protein
VLSIKRQRALAPYTWIETDTSEAFLPLTLVCKRTHSRCIAVPLAEFA